MASHIRFNDDIDEEYNPSDSEEEYTQEEKNAINKLKSNRKGDTSESEEEVYGVAPQSESDDDLALSDIEGQDDRDDLPDVRAWGKDKRKYYATDYVDPDFGGFQEKEAPLAEIEEEEAKNLQKLLVEQLDDEDFALDFVVSKQTEDDQEKATEELIKTDISKLSKRQKLQVLQKESPELFGLIDDFKSKMKLIKDHLDPIESYIKSTKLTTCHATDFVQTYRELIFNYCTNICMYLLLKSSKVNVKNHPVTKRLYQFRTILSQMDEVFEEIIKPQTEILIKEFENDETKNENKKKTLKVLQKLSLKRKSKAENDNPEDIKKKTKHVTFNDDNKSEDPKPSSESDSDNELTEEGREEMEGDADLKRGITYQMKKNKGLTPYRKKELRNPRVKHRIKFKKAKIRRKGAVREVRKELSRYGGEISGIKATSIKSVKFKS